MTVLPRKAKLFVIVMLGLLLISSNVFAGSTGKIKGVVTDKNTKKPVPGASVQIVGTTMGAMTDPDGKFLIQLVPPGEHVLRISSISYSTTEVDQVAVSTDITTEQNVALQSSITDLDMVIRVTADQDQLNIFETSNITKITAKEIQAKPIQNVDQLLKQTAGVVTNSDGEILIRGGRAGEVAYIVDGVNIGDPLGGAGPSQLGLSLTSGSIQEISIIKDGFDPEYGNALSGVVKITTQTGSAEHTNATVQYITDDFGNNTLNEYSQNYDNIYFTLSGPDPILSTKILPALGITFLEDKEVTYFGYAELTKTGSAWNYDQYSSDATSLNYDNFNLLGIDIPGRQQNFYNINANLMMKPINNMKVIFSYKTSVTRYTSFNWAYRYSPNTAQQNETNWQSYSAELTHQISKNMHYYLKGSYYNRDVYSRPGDPDNPGQGLDPDDFLFWNEFETYNDLNSNGVYDAPEPLVNLFPDTILYGDNTTGPMYTSGNYPFYSDVQNGYSYVSDFRFNSGLYSNAEGEPYIDANGNGVWDSGDDFKDTNGNGVYDPSRQDIIDENDPEPYEDGDINLGEPFTDVNGNGRYDEGIDVFVMSTDESTNNDLDRNSRYTSPEEEWQPGIPFVDRNGNGIYDPANFQYDPGEKFTDVNGNGVYDGASGFLNDGAYAYSSSGEKTLWHHHGVKQYVAEGRLYRQIGNHELKLGLELKKEYLTKSDIRELDQPYTGRPDGGVYPEYGALRDFYEYEPLSGSIYFRDNLEYGSMIASLGFRYDYFLQTTGLEDVAQNDDLGSGVIYGDRNKFSPRIGFSYPISDKAKIHFNYGHFYQLPSYTYMYGRNTSSASANDVIGNYNLDYEKTIQYSFGVKYAMSQDYSIDISGYYKDEFDKINSTEVPLGTGSLTVQQYDNVDYARSRGFEVSIEKRGGRLINGDINYTYAFAFGKQSQSRDNYIADFYKNADKTLSEKPLDDDIRHQINMGVQLVVPESMKPKLFGLRIPNGWTLSLQGKFSTGKPFTPSSNFPNMVLPDDVNSPDDNSMRMPSVINFDLRFEKYFKMVSLNWRFIVWVDNVLNSRNVTGVYSATGRADTSENSSGIILGGSELDNNPGNYDFGRQIKIGLQVSL